ncbi:MAG: D-alanyl-D-alanine carboxypeptidase [Oscillospiraceae bacterium]|nr:D-alanyl-D-alanine carboxypeptidase [Oscillospiraceae bacterium]
MKKTIAMLLIITALYIYIPAVDSQAAPLPPAPGTSAAAVILFDAIGGTVLYERHADDRRLIASTTKILTTLVALENNALDEAVHIKPEHTNVIGSSIYLRQGEVVTVRELLYGTMLASGNDAATALAYHTSGSVEDFTKLMNARAQELGAVNSSFTNPHGLDGDNHYSTARDLAMIMAEAMQNEEFRKIASTKNITIGSRSFTNHNRLLREYDDLVGGKTGFTRAAGRTLVTAAERDGMLLVCVTLSAPDDWDDHTSLYDWAFSQFQGFRINSSDTKYVTMPVISGTRDMVSARPSIDFFLLARKSDDLTIAIEAPRFVYAGVIRGARAGRIIVKNNGEPVSEIPLVYTENVTLDESERLRGWEKIRWAWYFANSRGGVNYGIAPVY